jgi:pimeloyl-ACP methyl ester carboxylesterase
MAFLNRIQVFYNIDGVEGDSKLFKVVRECSNHMAKPFPVTVHPFTSVTPSSCAYERGDPSSRNALVFLGGLTSGPHTSVQTEPIAEALQAHPELNYSFWEFRMRSSYTCFGFSSLANDAEDLAALVTYLKSIGKEKIVLLGSSTGSFFTLHSADSVY